MLLDIMSMLFSIFCYNFFMVLGKRIKELRQEKGLTQTQLALKAGINQSMIARWERGEREPIASAIVKLADALECTCDYLLGKTNDY